jgi:hypothetical protein
MRLAAEQRPPVAVQLPLLLEHVRDARRLPGVRRDLAGDPVPTLSALVAARRVVRGRAAQQLKRRTGFEPWHQPLGSFGLAVREEDVTLPAQS